MNYVNFLRESYKEKDKFFLQAYFRIGDKKTTYFFSINSTGLVYTMEEGEKSITLSKNEAER